MFFGVAALIATALIYAYTRCVRSTALVLACSLVAVVWQLGLVALVGFELDPYSILVPFLVFAIGVSHGAQKMNGIMQDIGRGTHRLVAARYTFRRLFLAGLTALLADAVGFAVLMVIDIPVIRELALTASIGVAVLIFTNLLLLPVLLSYVGVSAAAAERSLREENEETARQGPGRALGVPRPLHHAQLGARRDRRLGGARGRRLRGRAAPEDRRPRSRRAGAARRLALQPRQRLHHRELRAVERPVRGDREDAQGRVPEVSNAGRRRPLAWELQQVPGVQTTVSLADAVRQITAGSFEGNPKWLTINRNQDVLNYAAQQASVNNPDLFNTECSVMPVIAYLSDHKAETLDRVVAAAARLRQGARRPDRRSSCWRPAAPASRRRPTSWCEQANRTMLLYVYAAVIALCFITFRSWRAVVVAVVPLALTSILCEALMVWLGIGVKVATLPVIALGVGIGVDYALYLLSVQLAQQRAGFRWPRRTRTPSSSPARSWRSSASRWPPASITWAFSPIKFQADMGILLTFMFVWNMVGALVLIPALSHFLLHDEARMSEAHEPRDVDRTGCLRAGRGEGAEAGDRLRRPRRYTYRALRRARGAPGLCARDASA